jgi:hypothetical protein
LQVQVLPRSFRDCSSTESEQFTTNEQVGGSNPLSPFIFSRLRSSTESEHKSSKLEVASSNLAEAFFQGKSKKLSETQSLLINSSNSFLQFFTFTFLLLPFYFCLSFRGRLMARTADFESVNIGSTPFPEVFYN